MKQQDKIFIAGHRGLAGSAISESLKKKGYQNLVLRTHGELDLEKSIEVDDFFKSEKPDITILAAAKVGGIYANNTYPADFIFNNLQIQNNVIHAAHTYGVKKLLFLGSSCIYPKHAQQPMGEGCLLSGELESTNRAYAIAKIAGLEMCRAYRVQYGCNFISAMPTNLYGPGDNFNLENSHVLPALIHKCHLAKVAGDKSMTVWGSGKPFREFLYSSDLGDACVFLLENYNEVGIVNIGTGRDISIGELAQTIAEVVGFEGNLVFDSSKPDGTFKKLLDVNLINGLGWKYKVAFKDGIKKAYDWFLENHDHIRT